MLLFILAVVFKTHRFHFLFLPKVAQVFVNIQVIKFLDCFPNEIWNAGQLTTVLNFAKGTDMMPALFRLIFFIYSQIS